MPAPSSPDPRAFAILGSAEGQAMPDDAYHRERMRSAEERVERLDKEVSTSCWVAGLGIVAAILGLTGCYISPEGFVGLGILMLLIGGGFAGSVSRERRVAREFWASAIDAAKKAGVL
jgi:hypothetical protein